MKNIPIFLLKLRDDVFKLLPMREMADNGNDNHIKDYIYSLIISSEGAVSTYKTLETQKNYIYVINNLYYLQSHLDVDFPSWRKIILNCTRNLDDLKNFYRESEA